jgi:hypothetical protein
MIHLVKWEKVGDDLFSMDKASEWSSEDEATPVGKVVQVLFPHPINFLEQILEKYLTTFNSYALIICSSNSRTSLSSFIYVYFMGIIRIKWKLKMLSASLNQII